MSQLIRQFDIYYIVAHEMTGETDGDSLIDFDQGFNWASVAMSQDAAAAFEKALRHLADSWPDKVDSEDVTNIREEFQKQSWKGWSLSELLAHDVEEAQLLREDGLDPVFGVVIQVQLRDA